MKLPQFVSLSSASILSAALIFVAIVGCSSGNQQTTAPTVASAPAFSPAAGTYSTAQSVTLSDTTPGATIYYTTDGSSPSTSSSRYIAAINISATTTIQAIAVASGYTNSTIASSAYTIVPPAPVISLAAGTYTSVQNVTMSDATSGASIYYTTDGSIPTSSSTRYTSSVTIASTETINAIAVFGGQASSVATAAYIINLPPASLSANAGSGQSIQVGNGFSIPLQVRVVDANNSPLSGIGVFFSAPSSGPSATFSASSCTTSSQGLCSVTARANDSLGTFTITASTADLNTAFALTNTGAHSYVVTVATDATSGVASNCIDQATSSDSGNNNCSLRDAVAAAAASATSGQNATITFAQVPATTITLANGPIPIPSYTTIQGATSGAGSSLTNLITVDGNSAGSVFTESAGITQATLNNLIVAHGSAAPVGGGIYMQGSLSVNNSTFIANQASTSGGAISNNGGTLSIFGSTFANNSAQNAAGYGGAIDNYTNGSITISNSTFNGNRGGNGGALYSHGTATIDASTFAGNTATNGGGLYNLGTMTVRNSIINNNSPTNCDGLYCSPLFAYVLFSTVTPSPVDSSSITIAFTDKLGNTFSQTYAYGPFSTPTSIASAFGPYFYSNQSGLDTVNITGESIDNLLIIAPENGSALNPLTITNPGLSFNAQQMQYPNPLAANPNIYDQLSNQVNLGPLANNGGPTQTMLPLSGSTALCLVTPSTATGTDQRGNPRTTTVSGTTCQDAGAVQTGN